MPTIGEVFNAFAIKAGIKADNPELVGILAAPGLAQIMVPDTLVTQMDAGLLNIEAAKNGHPDIKNKYFAEAYNGMDAQIHGLPVDGELMDLIKKEGSTVKKIQLLVEKLKSAKPGDSAAEALKTKLAEQQEQLRILAEERNAIKAQSEQKIKDMQLDMALESMISGLPTVYDTLPADVKKLTLRSLINKNLQDSNAVLTVGENGSLVLVNKDGSKVFGSDHREVMPKDFLDKTFAPILKVSQPAPPAPPKPPGNGGQQPANNDFLSSFTQNAIADYQAGAANAAKMI